MRMKRFLLLPILVGLIIVEISFAQDTTVYDSQQNVQGYIRDNGQIYDKNWNSQGAIKDGRILDQNQNVKKTFQDGKIYDRNKNVIGYYDSQKIYDKNQNTKGYIKRGGKNGSTK